MTVPQIFRTLRSAARCPGLPAVMAAAALFGPRPVGADCDPNCVYPACHDYFVSRSVASQTGFVNDGLCNLTEAISAMKSGTDFGCQREENWQWPQFCGHGTYIDNDLSATYALNGTQDITSDVALYSGDNIVVRGTNAPNGLFRVATNATFTVQYITLSNGGTGSSRGRVITNHGAVVLSFATIKGGDVTGRACPSGQVTSPDASGCGGGIYSDGRIETNYAIFSGNQAVRGGAVFNDALVGGTNTGLGMDRTTVVRNKALIFQNETTSGGAATGSGNDNGSCSQSSSEGPAKAFDDNNSTKWCTRTAVPVTLTYDYAGEADFIVRSYSITSANDAAGRDPRNWVLEGDPMGQGNWEVLDQQSNQDFPNRIQTKTYTLPLTTEFKPFALYRLRVTANHGDGFTQMAEVRLYDQGGDGGAVFSRVRFNVKNITFSKNLAGCTSASCACTDNPQWCAANSVSSSSTAYGAGGAVYHLSYIGGRYIEARWSTYASNSAVTGGGIYLPFQNANKVGYNLLARNSARGSGGAPDMYGVAHGEYFNERNIYSNGTGVTQGPKDEVRSINEIGLCNLSDTYWYYGSVHLPLPGSMAVDRALEGVLAPGETPSNMQIWDQRGFARPEWNGSNTTQDIGGVERQAGFDDTSCPP